MGTAAPVARQSPASLLPPEQMHRHHQMPARPQQEPWPRKRSREQQPQEQQPQEQLPQQQQLPQQKLPQQLPHELHEPQQDPVASVGIVLPAAAPVPSLLEYTYARNDDSDDGALDGLVGGAAAPGEDPFAAGLPA